MMFATARNTYSHWFAATPAPGDIEAPPTQVQPAPRRDAEHVPCEAMLCSRALAQGRRVLLTHPMVDDAGCSYQADASAPNAQHPRNLVLATAVAAWQEGGMEAMAPHLECPIGLELMRQPVLTPNGETYERREIERWLALHDTYPLSNTHVPGGNGGHLLLRRNVAVQRLAAFLSGEPDPAADSWEGSPQVRVAVRQVPAPGALQVPVAPVPQARGRVEAGLGRFSEATVAQVSWHTGLTSTCGVAVWLACTGRIPPWLTLFTPLGGAALCLTSVTIFRKLQSTRSF